MYKHYADKLAAALRSGKYKQGTGRLRCSFYGEHCVLGVLADVVAPDQWILADHIKGVGPDGKSSCKGNFLTHDILLRCDLSYGGQDKLQMLNDTGEPFEKIASYIEENWQTL